MKNKIVTYLILIFSAIALMSNRANAQENMPRNYMELRQERVKLDGEQTDLGLIKSGLEIRTKILMTEKESIALEHASLKPAFTEYARRKMDYDRNCVAHTFDLNNPGEVQAESDCKQEKAWLEKSFGSLTERKTKIDQRDADYKSTLTQLKIELAAYQVKRDAWQVKNNAWQTNKEILIRRLAQDAVYTFKDQGIRDWITANVKYEIRKNPGEQEMLSPWVGGNSQLIFTDRFLKESTAMQENLMAFESGKLFMTLMKGRVLNNGKTLESWFNDYSGRHNSFIWSMKEAKHKSVGLSSLGDIDKESLFGYVFRAQVLGLGQPTDPKSRMEWEISMKEFRIAICQIIK